MHPIASRPASTDTSTRDMQIYGHLNESVNTRTRFTYVDVCRYVGMYVCMYVGMYVDMYVGM